MPPSLSAKYLMVLKAACALGVLVLLLGVDVASTKRNRKKKAPRDGPIRAGAKGKNPTGRMRTVKLLLDPNFVSTSPPPPPSRKSLSPWSYSYTHDDTLFPPRIAQAECLSTRCQDFKGWGNLNLESVPIFHQILVLKRVKRKKKKYFFKLESQTIKVGCTCVFPTSIQ
ncbi:hypothetical protein AAFF_G00202860 [Aldrovandia affinis]|uniref:Uncharacterized protein n=1 Tax=Aldrovandia affinis TaxID=143900 RepID=A0AAD7SX65_9TELE|nr:hypothetical protein AAFF_G00202860 [Aldrovandia affinis]